MSEWKGAKKRRYNEKCGRRWKRIEEERGKLVEEGREGWKRQKKRRESKEQHSTEDEAGKERKGYKEKTGRNRKK